MKRIMNQRGLAMFKGGTMTMESILADETLSVEQTADMRVTEISVAAIVSGNAGEDPSASSEEGEASDSAAVAEAAEAAEAAIVVGVELSVQLTQATEALAKANTKLDVQAAEILTATEASTTLQTKVDELEAQQTSVRPLLESAVNAIQMRLSAKTAETASQSVPQLVASFTKLSTEFANAFPTGQVSVVEEDEEQQSTVEGSDIVNLALYQRTSGRSSK
jgi:hypothetical protein